jgi:hypothetical protein
MKRYRHKETGNIAVETSSGKNYKVSEPQNFTIPKWIVENSKEWEEIINKVLIVTEDGKEIRNGDIFWNVFSEAITPEIEPWKANQWVAEEEDGEYSTNHCKYFSTKEKAEEWIYHNKPIYSRADYTRRFKFNGQIADMYAKIEAVKLEMSSMHWGCPHTIIVTLWEDGTDRVECRHGTKDKLCISKMEDNKLTYEEYDKSMIGDNTMRDEFGNEYIKWNIK